MASEAFDFRSTPVAVFDRASRTRRRVGSSFLMDGLAWRCILTSNKAASGEYVGLYFKVPEDELWVLHGCGHLIATAGVGSNVRYMTIAGVWGVGSSQYGREFNPATGAWGESNDIPDEAAILTSARGQLFLGSSSSTPTGTFLDIQGSAAGRRRRLMFPGESFLFRCECLAAVVGTDWKAADVWRPHIRVSRVRLEDKDLVRGIVASALTVDGYLGCGA